MSNRPFGWNDQYAINWCINQIDNLLVEKKALIERLNYLEAEICRLDIEKANRAGRKKVTPSSGDDGLN